MSAEFLAGAAGVVLGILALLGIEVRPLLAISAIVFGAALLLGAGANASLNSLIVESHYRTNDMARRMASMMVSSGTGAQVLVGLAAIVLGIIGLAVADVHSLTLILAAFLAIGAALTISGLAVSAKMVAMVWRR